MTHLAKLPKVIQLDRSDSLVFDRPAVPGEWAISGAFAFADRDPEDLSSKEKLALAQGFMGLGSFGRSTLVSVTDASSQDFDEARSLLANYLFEHYGAPSRDAALTAAEGEIAFASEICGDYTPNQLLLVERSVEDDGIHERFRTAERPSPMDYSRVWTLVPDADGAE